MESASTAAARLAEYFHDFDPDRCRVIAHSTQGMIVHTEFEGKELAVKIPTDSGRLRRLNHLALKREHAAYRQLQGVPGFAQCHGLFKQRFLVLDYLDATPLKQARLTSREAFFDCLLEVIETMHQRGVAHGDLKSRHNVLVGRDEQPYIVDLGAAVIRKSGWRPINRSLFRYLQRIDRNGWIKLKYGGYDQVDPKDQHLVNRSLLEHINSRLRRR